jgi:DNA-binding LacI/PurR family transcriptional regulator
VENGLVEKKAGVGTKVIKYTVDRNVNSESKTIGFFLPKSSKKVDQITQPFYSSFFYNFEKQCKKEGYKLLYSTLDEDTDDMAKILKTNDFMGILFLSNVNTKFILQTINAKMPAVSVLSHYHNMASVVPDNFNASYLACNHLTELGHKNIGIIKGLDGYLSTKERLEGCIKALSDASVPLQDEYILQGDWEFDGGYQAVKEMIQSAQSLPTALIGFNDITAIGAMKAIIESGFAVPDNFSIIGFDNIEQGKYAFPPLTTIEYDVKLMSKVAFQSIINQIQAKDSLAVKITIPVKLIIRESTSSPVSKT